MQIPQNTMNTAPGLECPVCGKGRIRLSLQAFLSQNHAQCPHCGQMFHMDKSGCGRLVELLTELHHAQERVDALRRGPLN